MKGIAWDKIWISVGRLALMEMVVCIPDVIQNIVHRVTSLLIKVSGWVYVGICLMSDICAII